MNNPNDTRVRSPFIYILFGALLLVLPPAILFTLYGDQEITGLGAKLSPLYFLLSLGGTALIAFGLTKSKKAVEAIDRRVDIPLVRGVVRAAESRSTFWVWLTIGALIEGAFTFAYWQIGLEQERVLRLISLVGFATVVAVYLLLWIFRKPRMSWILLLMDQRLEPRDEREQSILQRAALQALGITIIMLMITFVVLYVSPTPSILGLVFLLGTVVTLIQAVYGFLAWRMGLRS